MENLVAMTGKVRSFSSARADSLLSANSCGSLPASLPLYLSSSSFCFVRSGPLQDLREKLPYSILRKRKERNDESPEGDVKKKKKQSRRKFHSSHAAERMRQSTLNTQTSMQIYIHIYTYVYAYVPPVCIPRRVLDACADTRVPSFIRTFEESVRIRRAQESTDKTDLRQFESE